ncbi:26S proteasome regulatory subunit S1 [Heterostelium album PN500]|uniref:26S proteasome regulatory subunit S1 n=1 Tax=Heterostelium pallidum (strain ATCC 26659 / Pp 5 / PN500) TaxID=670386 RepID=D3BQY0_HETP5|nr:26S proteasome regulatory subunit S1 [Heterostelium album PN500]EFA76166.1 26S proteasome regulatory subunit S1 [Heterostelium album PN500]|eukprot:XP_020428300.1 26S proteasome regulatory subunit S1 [Heterostelium album PN500]
MGVTSVANYLSLLEEDQSELQSFALDKLNASIDEFWPEVASSINKIKKLSDQKSFSQHELASLILSKVYYHLGDFNNSMAAALSSGSLFNVLLKSEYVETLLYKFIDEYIKVKNENKPVDPRLESIVMGMFDRCFKEGSYKQALGIAIEARRLDIIEKAIADSSNVQGMLTYCLNICNTIVSNRAFRQSVLNILVKLYLTLEKPDFVSITQCLIFLDDAHEIATILLNLIKKDDNSVLLAYQLAFDLFQNGTQQFLANIRKLLPAAAAAATQSSGEGANKEGTIAADKMQIDGDNNNNNNKQQDDSFAARLERLRSILSGEQSISLYLEFLYRHCNTDLHVLQIMKAVSELHKGAIFYTGTLFANAIMHAGTTKDTYLRENLEWLSKATHWTKFTATASLGVINRGQIKDSKILLKSYLPGPTVNATPYSESGALYALGLIHAGHGEDVSSYLLEKLHLNNVILHHGASLGLGLASMATCNDEIYEELKGILYHDDAISGEGAGIAMGLVMLGSGSPKAIDEMLAYAHETQHEKIIRSLAMGLAFLMYGKEEAADTLIEQLITDKDPLLRYGGMYCIAMAYCGTGNNDALRKLLHYAVSDGNDSVRRASVTCIGFVLSKQPEKCPKTVLLLSESYNPHVRYGSALALGIACAGTGNREALDILKSLTTDTVGLVRQGAWIAIAMILIQSTKEQYSETEAFRKQMITCISDKREDAMSKYGAILGHGIIDAGGRNTTISLFSPSGQKNMHAIVGIAGFLQFWYWYPMTHFFGLALTPTAIIGVNKNLEMPAFSFKSNCKPSLFAYPPDTKPSTSNQPSKIETAILSVSRKNKLQSSRSSTNVAAEIEKEKKEKEQKEKEEKEQKEKEEKEAKEKEPLFDRKQNPARITPKQLQYVVFDETRYTPIKKIQSIGVVVLRDNNPEEPEQLVVKEKPAVKSPVTTSKGQKAVLEEPKTPQPFEFTD